MSALKYEIRSYAPHHAESWLRCWLLAAQYTHAGWHVYQQRPVYDGENLELVAMDGDKVVGLLDIGLEAEPGSLCLQEGQGQGFAWEFSVLPELWGRGTGTALVREAERRLQERGVRYLEWWSMDPRSQNWYERYGMECIDRHWRFAVEPDEEFTGAARGCQVVYAHLTCREEEWEEVRRKVRVITRTPLEPHLCKGFAHRF